MEIRDTAFRLKCVGNILFRQHKGLARDLDDSLVGATSSTKAELSFGMRGDVHPDDGKIAVLKFKNIWATVQ